MDCELFVGHLDELFDEEVGEPVRAELRGHEQSCPRCKERLAAAAVLRARLRVELGSEPMPRRARERVLTAIRAERRSERRLAGSSWKTTGLALVAAIAAVAVVVFVARPMWPGTAEPDPAIVRALVLHRQATLAGTEPEYATSDPREAERWFAARGLKVHVPDFRDLGLSLVGARLDEGPDGAWAAFVFKSNDRIVTGYLLTHGPVPHTGNDPLRVGDEEYWLEERDGLSVAAWSEAGLPYVLVGNLSPLRMLALMVLADAQSGG